MEFQVNKFYLFSFVTSFEFIIMIKKKEKEEKEKEKGKGRKNTILLKLWNK